MDNEKIGKLIRELRRRDNLTQEQLADMVGVGFRAVSKWERGINAPDISNMYELCKIFNITKDELLSGELKEKDNINPKNKSKSKIIITIFIIGIFIIALTSIFIYQNNRTYTYNIISSETEKDYYVRGFAHLKKGKISINLNKINFKDKDFSNIVIKNYEYEITSNNEFIFGYGYIGMSEHIREPITITEFEKNNKINIDATTEIEKELIVKNGMNLKFMFLTEDDEIITKNLILKLTEVN